MRFGRGRIEVDTVRLRADEDGVVREPCWFCGSPVEFRAGQMGSDVALLSITRMSGAEPIHGVCHSACVERAQGSLGL